MFESWLVLAFISAFCLGVYDVLKKASVDNNAALLTLWASTTVGSGICASILVAQQFHWPFFGVQFSPRPVLSLAQHGLIAMKAVIVSSSWVFAYLSLKNLPISIVAPIRASGPVWTLLGAVLIFRESLNPMQWLGFSLTTAAYAWFSLVGKKEGVIFFRNIWVGSIVLGTIIGAISGLYDKYLIQTCKIDPISVQLWFSVDMFWVQGCIFLIFRKIFPEKTPFRWRWSMPFVAVALLLADAAYFKALENPEAQIGLLSALRRSSLLVSFGFGMALFKDKNSLAKWGPVLCIITGLIILSWGSH